MTTPQPHHVPFPDFAPRTNDAGKVTGRSYWLCIDGHVYRQHETEQTTDAEIKYDRIVKPFVRGKGLNVRLGGGKYTRSLTMAVASVWATVACPEGWVAALPPGVDVDPNWPGSKIPRCRPSDVVWMPYKQQYSWSRYGRIPTESISIIES